MKTLVLALLFVTACAADRAKHHVVFDDKEYKAQSCEFAYDEGDTDARVGKPLIVSLPFAKAFNKTALSDLAHLSAEASRRLASQYGLTFYKAHRRFDDSCPMLAAFPALPNDLAVFWRRTIGDLQVVGLYLDPANPTLPSTRDSAVGIVREDGNRYIIVHEFMHHLFFLERDKAKLPRHHTLQERAEQLAVQLSIEARLAGHPLDDAAAASLLELYEPLVTAVDQLIKNSFIEEMLIESVLTEELDRGRLSHIPDGRANAREYIGSSYRRAVRSYSGLLENLAPYEKAASTPETRRRVATLNQRLRREIRELERFVVDERPDWMNQGGLNPFAHSSGNGEAVGCAHANQSAGVIDSVLSRLSPL